MNSFDRFSHLITYEIMCLSSGLLVSYIIANQLFLSLCVFEVDSAKLRTPDATAASASVL
jgi:hypothetical protein